MDIKKSLDIIKRGTVEVISEEELVNKLKQDKPLRIKFGADPTAPDIHLGHTVVLHKLKQFQELGHKIVFIIGDFTALIGDPSGRTESRPALTKETILKNAKTYQAQIFKILDKDKTELVFNSQWLSKLTPEDFMGLCSRYTVARMLERDDFQKRYTSGSPISMLEFMYPLIQGYDSVKVEADIELGGTDQKFNLLVGRELQRDYGQKQQVVITMPLLEGTDGVRKMSKSYGNYIGVNDLPKEIFGKIMSISDELMLRYYELLTNADLVKVKQEHPAQAKRNLASIIIERYYDKQAATQALEEFDKIFKDKEIPDEVKEYKIPQGKIWIVDLLVQTALVDSKKEAKRVIQQGGVKIDQEKLNDGNMEIDINKEFIIQVGKRKFAKIIPEK
ncbi:MAG: tyrosine--tRNA ligase [bacterium]